LKIYVSSGSEATQLKCGGIFDNNFIANCPRYVTGEKFENRSIIGEDIDKSKVSHFYGPQCSFRNHEAFP